MKFKRESLTAKEHDTTVIPANDYADPSVMKLFLLKTKDHISTFKSVMRNFEIEMVNVLLFFFIKKIMTKG
jgi:hypothetical protein